MAFTNFDTKEINCKIGYFGPPGAGKTQNLRAIYEASSDEVRAGLIALKDLVEPTQFFDFLPLSLGQVQGFHIKLHLFSLPLNQVFASLTSVLLKGLDGFVFVADSRIEKLATNIDALQKFRKILSDEGYNVADLPRVIQYNKRDMEGVAPIRVLRQELNPSGAPELEAIASQAVGTMETLEAMAKQVIHRLTPAAL